MNLTEAQAHALLAIGGAEEEHGYIPQRVVNDLMSYDLIYVNKDDEFELSTNGKDAFDELVTRGQKA